MKILQRMGIILMILLFSLAPLLTWKALLLLNMGTGSDDAWLGFWGNYIGVIISGLIAFSVAHYQIEKEDKERMVEKEMDIDRELLPYFNIEGNNLIFSAIRDNLPIQNVRLKFFDGNDQPLEIDPQLTGLGHIFPNKSVQLPINLSAFKRIDLEATLVNQTVVYFTYGNGLQGSHFEKRSGESEFKPYVLEKDNMAQKKAGQRLSHIDQLNEAL